MYPGGDDEVNFKDFYELQKTIYDKLEQIEVHENARFAAFEERMDRIINENRIECREHCEWMKAAESRLNSLETKVSWLIAGAVMVITAVVGAIALVAAEGMFG